MKVLLLVKRFDYGGAENHVSELANALACAGHSVWLMSTPGLQQVRLHSGVGHIATDFSDWKIIFHLFRIIRMIKSEHFDVIHAHQRFPIFLGTLASMWTKIPVVATVHGSALSDLRSELVRRKLSRVIAVRESCLSYIQSIVKPAGKVILIPNGVKLPANCVDRYVDPQCFSLYYISRMDRHHIRLLKFFLIEVWPKIIARYPRSQFHIVGEGNCLNEMIEWFIMKSDYTGIQASVYFEGYAVEVGEHYLDADLVMGVGRVAIESLVHGVPLLSVKHNHLGPIVTRSNLKRVQFANFVDLDGSPPSVDRFMAILNDFLDHRLYYENEAKSLQQLLSKEYNLDLIAKRIVEVYQDVIPNNF
ncbi:MAG: glycosyltransferase family 4 protein [Prolixibacteraceae bacterium]